MIGSPSTLFLSAVVLLCHKHRPVQAFTSCFTPDTCSARRHPGNKIIHSTTYLFSQENDSSDNDDRPMEGDENDPLLQELRYTKSEMFGKEIQDIPVNEELQRAAQNAENAFLAAMLEQTQQFMQIKQEEGSDRAVEAFMKRIKEEQNPREDVASDQMVGEEDGEEDSIANKWFVQRMQEEQNPSVDTDLDDGFDDAWQ